MLPISLKQALFRTMREAGNSDLKLLLQKVGQLQTPKISKKHANIPLL
jgi:hypothetical protein